VVSGNSRHCAKRQAERSQGTHDTGPSRISRFNTYMWGRKDNPAGAYYGYPARDIL